MTGLQTGHGSPEVMGCQHLGVVHDLTLVGGDLQRGQHVVHSRQAGGGAGREAVEAPLQDVAAGPARHVGALYALSLLADEGFLHHAVVLAQHPVPVNHLGVNGPWGGDAMGPESVFLRGLWDPFRMVYVEMYISFTHVKVPGDDGALLSIRQKQYLFS